MNKYIAGLIAAIASASTGFAIHVASQSRVQAWVDSHMQGHAVTPSWEVRYVALATSLEAGIALVILYALVRTALPVKSSLARGLLLGVLLLAVMGRLFRQPVMNLIVGNPFSVVVVQDGVSWVLWLCMCVVVALAYDLLVPNNAP
jgi:xanthosine utilization system XapX-like protein